MPKSKDLFDEALNEVIIESWGAGGSLFGGAPGGGSGQFVYAQNAASGLQAGGSPPYRTITGSPGGLNVKDMGEESEQYAKAAGMNKPFPLDRMEMFVADAFLSLVNLQNALESCVKFDKVLTKDTSNSAKYMAFPLKRLVDPVSSTLRALENIKKTLDSCVKYNKLLSKEKEKKVLIQHLSSKLELIWEMLQKIPALVYKIKDMKDSEERKSSYKTLSQKVEAMKKMMKGISEDLDRITVSHP